MTRRRVNSSRSLVSSSLRSTAAARGGGGTSAPVTMIAGTEAGSRASSAPAVHAGHPHVGQDQVDRVRGEQGQRLAAVPGLEHPVGQPVEQSPEYPAERGVVVGQQDRADGRGAQRQAEHDRGARARLAGQREVPAQDRGQPPGVRQAEPGATPADAGHLVELLEDMLVQAGRYAYAGIGHADLEPRARYPCAQPDLAVIGVLDSVRQQVTQDAGQGNLVGQDRDRSVRVAVGADDHLDRLALGHRPGQPAQPAEQRGQVHLGRVDVQLPRLGLGHVEQVVDQGQQGAARVPDQLGLVEPLGVEGGAVGCGLGQQPGQPDDGVQRGAQLVADVGPEPVLGFRGRAQPLGLLVQLRVQRHHAAVGLLQLVRQLAVQGHHAAVGLLQLGVEQEQLVLLLPEVVQRADQVLILPPQLVQGGLRVHRGQLLADQPRVRPHAGRAALGHPHDVAVGGDRVHQPGGRGDPVGRGLAVHGHGQQQLGLVDAERDDRGSPGNDGAAAYLAQRGGHPDLVLLLQGQDGGQAAAELARREDAGRVPDLEAGELAGLAVHGFSTRTPASSR